MGRWSGRRNHSCYVLTFHQISVERMWNNGHTFVGDDHYRQEKRIFKRSESIQLWHVTAWFYFNREKNTVKRLLRLPSQTQVWWISRKCCNGTGRQNIYRHSLHEWHRDRITPLAVRRSSIRCWAGKVRTRLVMRYTTLFWSYALLIRWWYFELTAAGRFHLSVLSNV